MMKQHGVSTVPDKFDAWKKYFQSFAVGNPDPKYLEIITMMDTYSACYDQIKT